MALTAGVCLATPAEAFAATPAPAAPKVSHVVSKSTSFTVYAKKSAHATKYKLFTSTNHAYLAVSQLSHAKSVTTTNPTLTVAGLKYSTTPYYYRLETINAKHHAYGTEIAAVGLAPAVPTNLQANATDAGVFLTWQSGAATGYRVEVFPAQYDSSTPPVFYTIRGQEKQFSPPNLTAGTAYGFVVWALNGTTPSSQPGILNPSDAFTPVTQQQTVTVGTYNILEGANVGQAEGDGTIASWAGTSGNPTSADRIVGVAKNIETALPDVVAIEEGASWAQGTSQADSNGVFQAQSLVNQLDNDGFDYALASTEIDPPSKGFLRTGVNIIYRTSKVQPVGTGGHYQIGVQPNSSPAKIRYMAYQEFQAANPTSTNADFLFVAAHLAVGNGTSYDQERENEAYQMLDDTQQVQQANPVNGHQLPVVYAGDYNSAIEAAHPVDGPGEAMRGEGNDDAYTVATTTTNGQYNSANNYFRTLPLGGNHIDYVWTTGGVATTTWSQIIPSGGRFTGVIPSDHNLVYTTLQIPYTP